MPVPKSSRPSLPPAGELPGTPRRSAQETFTRALASAVQAFGEGALALRAAYAELKRTFENAATTGSRNRPFCLGASAP